MNRRAIATLHVLTIVGLAVMVSCQRETRDFRPAATDTQGVQYTPQTDYRVGADPSPPPSSSHSAYGVRTPYEENAHSIAEGKRFYTFYNCYGCHAHGGGDMGPPLMDDRWIYGHSPEQIFATIIEGRPNGMPAFGSKIPEYQVWQLAAYVRSMSGLVPKDAAPGREDDMKTAPPENSAKTESPVEADPDKSTEMPQ